MSTSRPPVTACLVSWKRPNNLPKIISHLRKFPFIDDVLIWNNNPSVKLPFMGENVRVIQSHYNVITYGRYLCTYHARHDAIYTQDDDCLVTGIEQIYDAFLRDPVRIAHGLQNTHVSTHSDYLYDGAQMSLVGWGAFFLRDWVKVLDSYIAKHGRDNIFLRESDRIFSLLLNRRHTACLLDADELVGAKDIESLWKQPDHFAKRKEIVHRALRILGKDHCLQAHSL